MSGPRLDPQFIRRGREFLEKNEWGQQTYDACCAVGALAFGNGIFPSEAELRAEVEFLEEIAGTGCLTIWNDESSRTKQDVLALFDRAIEILEAA